jgi:hypothetical protein
MRIRPWRSRGREGELAVEAKDRGMRVVKEGERSVILLRGTRMVGH